MGPKRIYFHIDEYHRDAVVASALKQYFAKKNIKIIYGARYLTETVLPNHLDAFDAVILPKAHFIRKKEKYSKSRARLYCLMTESVGWQMSSPELAAYIILSDFKESEPLTKYVDGFFLWGQKGKDAIDQIAAEYSSKCHVIGHPRLDRSTIHARHAPQLNDRKIHVGIMTRFSMVNNYKNEKIPSLLTEFTDPFHLSTHGYRGSFYPCPEDSIYAETIEIRILFQILEALSKNDDILIEFRTHPREDKHFWKKFFEVSNNFDSHRVTFSDGEEPFSSWGSRLNYIIAPPSTSFYEAFVLGICPISIHNINKKRKNLNLFMCEDRNRIMEDVFSPSSIDELLNFITMRQVSPITSLIKDELKQQLHFPSCNESLQKMSSIISRDLDVDKVNYYHKVLSLGRYFIYLAEKMKLDIYFSFMYSFRLKRQSQSARVVLTPKVVRYINSLSRK